MPASVDGFMDGKAMELACDTCGTPLHTTVGEARRATALQCPNGHPLAFDAAALDEEIRQAEQKVASIMNRFRFDV